MDIDWREIGDRAGSAEQVITVPAGEYIQIRHGTLQNPTVDLQIQSGQGKKITYYVRVTAEESAA